MPSLVERTPSGAKVKCRVCASVIGTGEVRVVDVIRFWRNDDELERRKYAHLTCAIESRRELAYKALCSTGSDRELVDQVLIDVARVDAKLASEVHANRAPTPPKLEKRTTPLDDPRTEELLRELEAEPRNRELLAVLADHLQQRGDERGELIVLDLVASAEPAAITRRNALYDALAPVLEPKADRVTWGIGFLCRLDLRVAHELAERAAILAHPSCRLLEALYIDNGQRPLEIPPDTLPRTLRTLSVDNGLAACDLSWLPHLETLNVVWASERITHPAVRTLELKESSAAMLVDSVEALPAVEHLAIVAGPKGLGATLVKSGWLARLRTLHIERTDLTEADIRVLEAAHTRKLARLAVKNCTLTSDYRVRLAALCNELEFTDARPAKSGVVWIENTKAPDLGRGRVVREFEGKVEVAFPSGNRTFKADAPFLKRTRED